MTALVTDNRRTVISCESLTITLGENVCWWTIQTLGCRRAIDQLEGPVYRLPSAFPYSEWADRWEKEHLAGSDFQVILDVNQWHPVDVCLLCWLPVSLPGLETCSYHVWDPPASWGSCPAHQRPSRALPGNRCTILPPDGSGVGDKAKCSSWYITLSWLLVLTFLNLALAPTRRHILYLSLLIEGFPGGLDGKEAACSAGDLGLILGLGRSLGERHGYPLWYSCLKYSMDKGAWWAPWGSKELDMTEQLTLFSW